MSAEWCPHFHEREMNNRVLVRRDPVAEHELALADQQYAPLALRRSAEFELPL
jgi:hypothetical protein